MARRRSALRGALSLGALLLAACPAGPPAPAAPAAPPAPWPAPGGLRQAAPPALDDGPVYAAEGAEAGWPASPAPLAPGAGREALERHCATCHGLTYVTQQPPLPPAGWAAVVAKMQQVHGAALPAGAADEVAGYLGRAYGPDGVAASWSAVLPRRGPAPAAGARVFAAACAACHQVDGGGLPGAFPPLAGRAADLARLDRAYLLRVALFGLQGPLRAGGVAYDSAMPGWAHLPDEDLAAVLDHVTTAWGGAARLPPGWAPYSAAEVAATRAERLAPRDVLARRPSGAE